METQKVTKEMYEALKKPLPTEAVKPHPSKTFLSTIKAIYVTERLNDIFGCGAWQIKAERIDQNDKGMIVVKTTLSIPEYGICYESFGGNDNGGEGSKNFDLSDAYKGATTDGITKIGSYLGIGIEVFKGHGNGKSSEPKKEVEKNDNTLMNAMLKLEKTDSVEAVHAIWDEYPDLQKNEVFKKECLRLKNKFSPLK